MQGRWLRAKLGNSLISRFFLAAALTSLTLVLFACPNPTSTDLVLSVVGTEPPSGATKVDPGQAIVVTFNKDLDPSCLRQSPVAVAPSKTIAGSAITLTFSYDSPNRKLSIEPHPFFERNSTYIVSFMTNLKDSSGGTLPKQVDFAFTTGDNLAGDIEINGGSPFVTTSDTTQVALTLTTNRQDASKLTVHIANSDSTSSTTPYDGAVGAAPTMWSIDPGEGLKEVVYQFTDSITNAKSAVRTATIIRDTVAPTLVLGPAASYFNKTEVPIQLSASANDANGFTCLWSSSPSNAVFTPSAAVLSPKITPTGSDGPYIVTVTVTDPAGHQTSNSLTITKDTVAPSAPTNAPTGYTTFPQSYTYPYDMTWYWSAGTSSNPYQTPDSFLILLNGKPPTSGVLSHPLPYYSYGKITAYNYGTYTLSVRQVDAAGNQSDPLDMPITVSLVFPPNGSTNISRFDGPQWDDFSNNTAGHSWKVHLWDTAYPKTDLGKATGSLLFLVPDNPLGPGETYNWYVEWTTADGTKYTSPSDGTVYKFTVSP